MISVMSAKRKTDLKIIILGDYSVGKTSLIRRYIDGTFDSHERTTLGAAFFLKQWGPYNVAIWDTAGDERYSGLSHFYCRNAGAAIMAFDLTKVSTFESLWARFSNILEAANEDCLKVVVGTKIDLLNATNKRDITFDEGRKLSLELNSHIDTSSLPNPPYFETSSLLNENVDQVFEYILQHCLPLSSEQKRMQINKQNKSAIDLLDDSGEHSKSKKCCG